MLTITNKKKVNNWKVSQEAHCDTYLPSPLLLALILENGWKVVNIDLAPSQDQLGFVYLVTLKSISRQQYQQLMLPRTTLIEKILEENLSLDIPAKISQPSEEWLLAN
jgi:hypothetical protein